VRSQVFIFQLGVVKQDVYVLDIFPARVARPVATVNVLGALSALFHAVTMKARQRLVTSLTVVAHIPEHVVIQRERGHNLRHDYLGLGALL
jgi:hypothetical protein